MKKLLLALVLFVVFGILGYFGVLFVAHGGDIHFLEIDACLDKGGVWNSEKTQCYTDSNTYGSGGNTQ